MSGERKSFNDLVPSVPNKARIAGDGFDESLTTLHRMFHMQRTLCECVFSTQGITDNQGKALTLAKIVEEVREGKLGANDLPVIWIKDFARAIHREAVTSSISKIARNMPTTMLTQFGVCTPSSLRSSSCALGS